MVEKLTYDYGYIKECVEVYQCTQSRIQQTPRDRITTDGPSVLFKPTVIIYDPIGMLGSFQKVQCLIKEGNSCGTKSNLLSL